MVNSILPFSDLLSLKLDISVFFVDSWQIPLVFAVFSISAGTDNVFTLHIIHLWTSKDEENRRNLIEQLSPNYSKLLPNPPNPAPKNKEKYKSATIEKTAVWSSVGELTVLLAGNHPWKLAEGNSEKFMRIWQFWKMNEWNISIDYEEDGKGLSGALQKDFCMASRSWQPLGLSGLKTLETACEKEK